jgi:hypothetical protein
MVMVLGAIMVTLYQLEVSSPWCFVLRRVASRCENLAAFVTLGNLASSLQALSGCTQAQPIQPEKGSGCQVAQLVGITTVTIIKNTVHSQTRHFL